MSPKRAEVLAAALSPEVMTLDEVCAMLRLSRPTVVKMFKAGLIPGSRDGRAYRFLRSSLVEHIDGRRPAKAS